MKSAFITATQVFYADDGILHDNAFDLFLVLLSRRINIMPPTIPVITPIGNSLGEMIVRAITSHTSKKALPLKNDAMSIMR